MRLGDMGSPDQSIDAYGAGEACWVRDPRTSIGIRERLAGDETPPGDHTSHPRPTMDSASAEM